MASLDSELPTYRADIDGLRALAVLSVIGYHAFPSWISGGFVGVNIFFVISGFLISSIVFTGLGLGIFSFRKFYFRRIRRIFPALALVLIACIVSGWFVLLPSEYKQLGKHVAGGAGFISNFLLWNETGYFDSVAETKPLLHLWSLGIEEQFYLLWPLLIYLAWRRINIFVLLLTLLLLSFYSNISAIQDNAISSFYSPVARFWELLTGALLAWSKLQKRACTNALSTEQENVQQVPPCRGPSNALRNELIAIAGLALLVGTILGLDATYTFPGWWALLPTTGSVLVILAGSDTWISRNLLGHRTAIWFGLISYPLYLWHWPILTFARILQSGTTSTETTTIALALSLVLAAATYQMVERPIRFGTDRERKAVVLCVAIVLIGSLGFYIYERDGFDERPEFVQYQKNRSALVEDVSMHNAENCVGSQLFPYQTLNKDFFCMDSRDRGQMPRNIIIGDSHAYPIYFGLYDLYVRHRDQDLAMLGAPGCPPFLGLESFERGSADNCMGLMNALLQRAINDNNVKTVILVSRGPLYTSGVGYGETDKHNRIVRRANAVGPESNSAAYKSALLATIRALQQGGKQVILIMPPPELGFEPMNCVKERPIEITSRNLNNCGVNRDKYLERSAVFRNIISTVGDEYPRVFVVDPAQVLCDQLFCRAYSKGHFLYSDNNHLSAEGARTIIASFSIPY